MFSPEVRIYPSPRTAALDFLMDAISQLEEEFDKANDTETVRTIEASLEEYNHAFDLIMRGNYLPFVASFLRDQVTELSTQVEDQEDYENIQRLSCLAADLSRTA